MKAWLRRAKWLRRLTRAVFPASPRKVRVRAGRFVLPMILIPRDHRAILLGVYEQPVVRVLEVLLTPGMVAVDGGAHIGFFTLLMAHRVRPGGRVVAFEIHPGLLALLQQNAALAPPDVRVEVRPLGLADRPGKRFVQLREGGYTSLERSGEVPVSVTTLDEVFREARVDLVKLDVEGLEERVLAGGRAVLRRSQPALVLELHEPVEDFLEKPTVRELATEGYAFFLVPSSPPEAPHLVGLSPRFSGVSLPGDCVRL